MNQLWEQEAPSICRFCAFAKRLGIGSDVFCEKKSKIFSEDFTCKKFCYDILKREVRRRAPKQEIPDKGRFKL